MVENTLTVSIHRPIADVFEFAVRPTNTPRWITHLTEEIVSEWPVKVGTKYRNRGQTQGWAEYVVTTLEPNALFEMASADGRYHVRYTFERLSMKDTRLVYSEWVDTGDLDEPFTQEPLDRFKAVLEYGH